MLVKRKKRVVKIFCKIEYNFNMTWQKKKKVQGKNHHYSVAKKLRKEKKINEDFEVMISGLLLEEVIALKLEIAAKAAGGVLYGVPIWISLKQIVNDAVLKYAYSATRTKMEAARFLGIDFKNFKRMVEKYKTESYFEEENKEKEENKQNSGYFL